MTETRADPPAASQAPEDRRLPGEEGAWMFVLGDLMVFALFFGTYLAYRAEAPEAYAQSQATLDRGIGLFNTLALLTSSAAMALAVKLSRQDAAAKARRWLLAAIGCGLLFVGGKVLEYSDKFAAGYGVESDEFFMFFFMLTGIHFVHVIVGLILLTMLYRSLRAPLTPGGQRLLESGGIFWHMVDLLWIVLFTLFYLIR